MEKITLSLKSIYKLLMTNDFPIYSESVIDEKNRKGQTLLKFWQHLVAGEFRCLPCGQVIWRNDGRRNRYISNLCNRNPELKLYPEYAKELASQISTATLLNQIQRFSVFLSGRNYKHDVLLRRIRELMRLAQTDDPHVSDAIATQIKYAIDWQNNDSNKSLFHASYLLTVLMLYAAAGEAMDDSAMDVLRANDYSISALWDLKLNPPAATDASVTYLTERVGMLQDKPLPHQRFFGREEELFNLKEMAVQGRKCLISGVGGIGKTELLRQLIRSCEEDQSIDCIAVVPYTVGLVESFGKAFLDFRDQEAEERFNHILYQLEQKSAEGKRVLLLVDNMNSSVEEDQALVRLTSLSCAVLISSRRPELKGFETYRILDPSVTTCSLIFRDNYGKPLTHEDRSVLNELLHNASLRHPLTLRLMARAAHSNGWRVQELKDHLLQSQISLTWVEDDHLVKLDQIYHQLYSYTQIPNSCEKLVELFTLLPLDSYSSEFLANVFSPFTAGDDLTYRLNLLAEGGWLDETDNGYAMHPLVAQCLRRKVLTEDRLETILQCLYQNLPNFNTGLFTTDLNPHDMHICTTACYIISLLTGKISRQCMYSALCASSWLYLSARAKNNLMQSLNRMMKRCTGLDDNLEILYNMLECSWQMGNPVQIEKIYQKQKQQLTVSKEIFLNFCILAASGTNNNLRTNPLLAQDMLFAVLNADATINQTARAYKCLASLKREACEFEEARVYGEKCVAFLQTHPDCDAEIHFIGRYNLCSSYLEFRMEQKAANMLGELEKLVKKHPRPLFQMYYFDVAGHYEMNYGDLEKALAYLRSGTELILEYYGADVNYCQQVNKMCIVLQRLKRYDEAFEKYQLIIQKAKLLTESNLVMMYSNNLGVLYLELEMAQQAKNTLDPILEIARKIGGVAQGECVKNMARAYGMLGEYKKEQECLIEAVPLLEAAYGLDHPRAAAARERLKELTVKHKAEQT